MAKKIDSEALLKQRFWILLGVLVPLVAVVMIVMWRSFPDKINQKIGGINTARGAIDAAKKNPKNKSWIPLLDHRYAEAVGKKNDIWYKAWASQKDFLTEWPADMPENMNAKPIWSDFTEESREKYAADLYQMQIREIPKLPQPEGARDEVVQFKGGWEKIVDLTSLNPQPESEEIWLAQEDLWIQKEMLRLIRDANELAGTLKRVEPRTPEEKAAGGTFANAVWRMSVKIQSLPGKIVLDGKLTNASPWRQPLGLRFRIHAAQGGFAPEEVAVEGEPLLPGESCKFSGNLKVMPDPVDHVSQLFDWRTAPIKRIDALRIPAHSSKNASVPLVKNETVSKGEGKTTASGLTRARYIETQGPVRRFPFGIALIVEQQYLQDVLSAFANSRLRIVLTQVMWQHFRDVIHPPVKSAANAAYDPLAHLKKKPKSGGVGSSVARGARTAERDEPAPAAATGPAALPEGPGGPAPEEAITDLLEVAIYGTATLYRPYDPKDNPLSPAAAPTAKK
jgi:hypothetical protein